MCGGIRALAAFVVSLIQPGPASNKQRPQPKQQANDTSTAPSPSASPKPITTGQAPSSPQSVPVRVSHIPARANYHPATATTKPPQAAVQHQQAPAPPTMADRQLTQILTELKSQSGTLGYNEAAKLLSRAKLLLLQLKALTPTSTTSQHLLSLARETYEQGALYSIRARNADAFTRYVQQLAPFYEQLPAASLNPAERSKVTGLYLLLLLTQGRYAEFHSELESLSTRDGASVDVEGDRYLGYPIRLERWLMEGSYDRVWKAMKKGEVPCEEYGVFSEILTSQIRSEIASSSERAYPSLPLSSTKSLLFLDSEGAVIDFANQRGWIVRDGQIFFPTAETGEDGAEPAEKEMSQMIIENTLGYARELETIV